MMISSSKLHEIGFDCAKLSTVRKSSVRHCVKALHCMDFGGCGTVALWHVMSSLDLPELLCLPFPGLLGLQLCRRCPLDILSKTPKTI